MQNIVFLSDDHFGARPGFFLNEVLQKKHVIKFRENDWRILDSPSFADETDLLILNMIFGTGEHAAPSSQQANAVKAYLTLGKPLLLLHGASAAFWPFEWWRRNVGLRWIRANDPDNAPPSTHPVIPFSLSKTNANHRLTKSLVEASLPEDELYIRLYPESHFESLLETEYQGVRYSQCYLSRTQWGGEVACYLPGHHTSVTQHSSTIENINALINYLLSKTP